MYQVLYLSEMDSGKLMGSEFGVSVEKLVF